jgi:hypothetical protein
LQHGVPGMCVAFCALRGPNGLKTVSRYGHGMRRAVVLTEDPPFGGLWCDQPAYFYLAESRLRRFQRARLERVAATPAKSVVFARGA